MADEVVETIATAEKGGQALRKKLEDIVGEYSWKESVLHVIALGVLILIEPWAIEALGFGELGPIEGTFAAAWQSRYAGYVPKGSLFSFFQRLGITYH
ncbi:hypothetical protein K458DRAFT_427671 [Lentithecium fluviatile CBS 122367]|uniref:Uncharacterized protein n=1 Tax=Lentithecium fluviatile CBS 122367 TaxID=1168545 RepID=A0A6G1JGF8_9PLEO|nr:hypothetical protein K458DRAFT_427671 [Lentithecium fluviatile CBS 122367]